VALLPLAAAEKPRAMLAWPFPLAEAPLPMAMFWLPSPLALDNQPTAILALPVAELVVFIMVAASIGFGLALLLVLATSLAGGLLLRHASDGTELDYVPVLGAIRHGSRPAKLPPLTRMPGRQDGRMAERQGTGSKGG